MRSVLATSLTLLLLTGCGATAARPSLAGPVAAASLHGLSRAESLALHQALDPAATDAWERDAAALEAKLPRGLDVRSPAARGVTFGHAARLDLRFKGADLPKVFALHLDGRDVTSELAPGALRHQWVAELRGLAPGAHALTLVRRDDGAVHATIPFRHEGVSPRDRLVALADATVKRFDVREMGWDWGEGLLLYALLKLDAQLGEPRYRPFVESYYSHWIQKGIPTIDWSDKCAPALAARELYRLTGTARYKAIAEDVVRYLKTAEPTAGGGLNHLGTWWPSRLYPTSMWVDSLMMYNVFAGQWAQDTGDAALLDFAAEQPLHFAKALQHPQTKLWKHAWYPRFKGGLPTGDSYWLRGNGWALAAIPETISVLPESHPARGALLTSYRDHAAALVEHQDATGLWFTVLNRPGKTYLESSGTALMALGLLKGVHAGYLPESYREPGRKAYLSLLGRLQEKAEGPSMPEISHNTMPYTFCGYKLVPQRNDLAFGLAAMILAGVEFERE